MLFQEVPARFLSRPLVGIEYITLYGNSMRFGGCTELQGWYQKMALAATLYSAKHYVAQAFFRESYYSLR